MKYHVVIGGRTAEVDVDGELITVDGRPYQATLEPVPGTPLRQLLLDGRPLTLLTESMGQGRWALTESGQRWEVEVLDERTRHIQSLAGSSDQRRKADVLKAPMPGLVVRVHARLGQSVAAGSGLIVLEAMKMENELKAAAPARVKAVLVTPGQAVEKGQVLVEFENSP